MVPALPEIAEQQFGYSWQILRITKLTVISVFAPFRQAGKDCRAILLVSATAKTDLFLKGFLQS